MKDIYPTFTAHQARARKIAPMLSSLLDQWPANRVILLKWSNTLLGQAVGGKGRISQSRNMLHFRDSRVVRTEDVVEPVGCHIDEVGI